MKRLVLGSLILCMALLAAPGRQSRVPAHAAKPEDQLRELRAKIEKEEKVITAIKGKRATVLGSLEDLDRRIVLAEKEHRTTQKEIRKTSEEVKTLREDLSALRERIEKDEEAAAGRLVSFYRFGKTGFLPVLFSSGPLPGKFRDLRAMRTILEADWSRLQTFHDLLQEKQRVEDQLTERLAQKTRLQDRLRKSIEDQKTTRQSKDGLLFQLTRDEDLHKSLLAELEQSAAELSKLIRDQEVDRERDTVREEGNRVSVSLPTTGSLELRKGTLPWPVEGEIYRHFGKSVDPMHQGTIMNQGIDIQTKEDLPVRAVGGGVVAYADWFRGYGKLLIIHHGGKSYSVLSHMSRLTREKGERVQAGEVVGYTGDTGSTEGCLVHFEIWNDGKARDPLEWLQAGKRSVAQAPERTREESGRSGSRAGRRP